MTYLYVESRFTIIRFFHPVIQRLRYPSRPKRRTVGALPTGNTMMISFHAKTHLPRPGKTHLANLPRASAVVSNQNGMATCIQV